MPAPNPSGKREEDEERAHSASHPAGRGWVPLSRDLGIPGEHGSDDPVAALGCSAVFTRELRIRFLDHLAFKGNVRAAAVLVGVSHETAYRKRRQDAAFAALWDAALVHARGYSESQLATRALDGIELAVYHRGEIVGYQVKHDSRLLLAHLARLDKRVENDAAAQARAGRFDELLAEYAGHAAPEGFAEAAEEARDPRASAAEPPLTPTRAEYVAWLRSQALDALVVDPEADEAARIEAEAEAMDEAGEAAAEVWDEWRGGGRALVEAIVFRQAQDEQEEEGEREEEGEDELPSPLAGEGGAPSGAEGEGGVGGTDDVPGAGHPPEPGAQARPRAPAAAGAADPSPNPLPQGERAKGRSDRASDPAPTDLPYEIKSAPPEPVEGRNPRNSAAQNRVTSVNPPGREGPCRAAPGREPGAPFHFSSLPHTVSRHFVTNEGDSRCT